LPTKANTQTGHRKNLDYRARTCLFRVYSTSTVMGAA
jgi:hypothetical protein